MITIRIGGREISVEESGLTRADGVVISVVGKYEPTTYGIAPREWLAAHGCIDIERSEDISELVDSWCGIRLNNATAGHVLKLRWVCYNGACRTTFARRVPYAPQPGGRDDYQLLTFLGVDR